MFTSCYSFQGSQTGSPTPAPAIRPLAPSKLGIADSLGLFDLTGCNNLHPCTFARGRD
jgi:hypothetical protein